jgi:hypothetical protein
VPVVASIGKRRAARLAPSRMADTRVLCVSADTVCDSMLSVADDVVARPVHERTRSVDTQRVARRSLLELSSGVVDVVVMIMRRGMERPGAKKSRLRCLQRAGDGSPDRGRAIARRNQ